jgi:hypothetical protein
MTYTLVKIDQWQRQKAETEILKRFSEKSLEVYCSVFKEATRNFIIIFVFHRAAQKVKRHLHMYRKYVQI